VLLQPGGAEDAEATDGRKRKGPPTRTYTKQEREAALEVSSSSSSIAALALETGEVPAAQAAVVAPLWCACAVEWPTASAVGHLQQPPAAAAVSRRLM
jgi:hypothetical protein